METLSGLSVAVTIGPQTGGEWPEQLRAILHTLSHSVLQASISFASNDIRSRRMKSSVPYSWRSDPEGGLSSSVSTWSRNRWEIAHATTLCSFELRVAGLIPGGHV